MTRIILDVNIVLSAIIKDSFTREFITKSEHEFWFPEQALDRIKKYKDLIIKKSGLNPKELDSLFEMFFEQVNIAPRGKTDINLAKAKEVMEHIDKEDVLFIACALSISDSVIWSNDKHLKKQKLVRVYTTKELLKER